MEKKSNDLLISELTAKYRVLTEIDMKNHKGITPMLFAGYKYNNYTKEWNYVNKGDRYRYNVASDKWEYKPKKTKVKYNSMYGKWSWEIDKKSH